MLGWRALSIAIVLFTAFPVDAAPRMRICTPSGMVTGTHKVFFGGGSLFYVGLVDPDDPSTRFRPDKALRNVEWWMHRTEDLDGTAYPVPVATHGRSVAHRQPPRQNWGDAARPFAVPEHMVTPWSSGRYVVRAVHPVHGETRIRVTVATILLLGYTAVHEDDRYEAKFRVALADPDRREPKVSLELKILDRDGRAVDRLAKTWMVRQRKHYESRYVVRVSSQVSAESAARRLAGDDSEKKPTLRVVPDSKLRVLIGDRVFQFPLPLEEGMLVRKSDSAPFGREGTTLVVSSGKFTRSGGKRTGPRSHGSSRVKRPGSRSGPSSTEPSRTHGKPKTVASDDRTYERPRRGPRSDEKIEIVSDAGKGRRLKIWIGETATFAARLKPSGLDALFAPSDWLRDVHWTLRKFSLPTDRRAIAIVPGANVTLVGRYHPEGLWGAPPSMFICPDDLHGHWEPGLYVLRADRGGGSVAEVRLDVAKFEVADVDQTQESDRCTLTLRLRLTDPFETRNRIPVTVRIIGPRDEVQDYIRGVSLSRDRSRRDQLQSGVLRISSTVKTPCRNRYEGRAENLSPGAPGILKMRGDSRLRVILGSAVFTYPLPLFEYEILTGLSGATDQPLGE